MKPIWKDILLSLLLGLVLPWLVLSLVLRLRAAPGVDPAGISAESTRPLETIQTVPLTMYLRQPGGDGHGYLSHGGHPGRIARGL